MGVTPIQTVKPTKALWDFGYKNVFGFDYTLYSSYCVIYLTEQQRALLNRISNGEVKMNCEIEHTVIFVKILTQKSLFFLNDISDDDFHILKIKKQFGFVIWKCADFAIRWWLLRNQRVTAQTVSCDWDSLSKVKVTFVQSCFTTL